ncbi:MAG: hypothetical protein ACE5J5_08490 [Candidatus Hydrothermarchaeales archaeon]
MINKKILEPNRVRHIDGGFSFIPHRFMTEGFLSSLGQKEILLYFFLVLVSDRYGLSFYSYDAICSLLQFTPDECNEATDGLIEKDLIAFDGKIYQVLDLPSKPVQDSPKKLDPKLDRKECRRHVKNIIQQSLWEVQDGQ